jgi:hypothetical protein
MASDVGLMVVWNKKSTKPSRSWRNAREWTRYHGMFARQEGNPQKQTQDKTSAHFFNETINCSLTWNGVTRTRGAAFINRAHQRHTKERRVSAGKRKGRQTTDIVTLMPRLPLQSAKSWAMDVSKTRQSEFCIALATPSWIDRGVASQVNRRRVPLSSNLSNTSKWLEHFFRDVLSH